MRDDGSDLDLTEQGQTGNGSNIRRKVVMKKTKGYKLRLQNADRYKGFEERKRFTEADIIQNKKSISNHQRF